ncbi:S1C family serine protease [Leptobacterium sp. I13]|uniref:S1C family serine protease n=1 Tax=Leptobacterium meishanense TaxID=3128904 RepID=UPI0030EE571D
MKKVLSLFLVSFLGGLFTLGIYKVFFEKEGYIIEQKEETPRFITTNYSASPFLDADKIDFTEAAERTVHAVVHVKNMTVSRGTNSIFDFFYGSGSTRERAQIGTGSGVIISPDGYIVTNNHVIENATKLEVTLNNNRTYEASLVGADPSTDIALLKVESNEPLPFLAFGDSDNTKIGEWVLAVGNPFNLTSTVTAGIISAKARDLNERDGRNQSFIQTDAAVNPGNSGGALVNINGDLIGINTAITSQTGAFVGYAFAVPSNIAKKVVDDLLEYGNVQEGILGVQGNELNSINAETLGIDDTQGFYISNVLEDSGAERAGLRKGDIIKRLDNIDISKYADLSGYLKSKRPNDIINVTVNRDGIKKTFPVTLLKDQTFVINELGLIVKNLSKNDINKYNTRRGVKIIEVANSVRGYDLVGKILIEVNDTNVENIDDVKRVFSNTSPYEPTSIVMLDEYGERERLIFR